MGILYKASMLKASGAISSCHQVKRRDVRHVFVVRHEDFFYIMSQLKQQQAALVKSFSAKH